MYKYNWDEETGGLLLLPEISRFSNEPRPVYYKELDILGDDKAPLMWAETNNYIYKGRTVAKTKGGALYTAPEIIILDEPEPNGLSLEFVDIAKMVEKNRSIMEELVYETIQKVYNTYKKYRDKIDVFYVAFSGGKDSVVAFDIVQRALPHDDFMVFFANTDMEFPTTLSLVNYVEQWCKAIKIEFRQVSAVFSAEQSWKKFGPPARRLRWCCTVHKTAPIINKLSEVIGLNRLRSVMITGVRGDESTTRSDYDDISLGKKMPGQYSFHPILDWSSAEVFLHIFAEKLPLNEAYKYGFSRVGCIMCPNSSGNHEYIKQRFFNKEVEMFSKIIVDTSKKDLSGENAKKFLETGGWKTRLTGRELKITEDERFKFEEKKDRLIFDVLNLNDDWVEWYKTIGDLDNDNPKFVLEYDGILRNCELSKQGDLTRFTIYNARRTKNSIEFVYLFKCILAKSQYCIKCMACEAECPYRNISMQEHSVQISDK